MEINWLLIGILVVVGVCIYHGYRVGLMRMVLSVATFLVTIVLVRLLAPVGVQMLKSNEYVYNGIRQPVEELLEEHVNGQVRTEEVLENVHLSEDVKSSILEAAQGIGIEEIELFTPQIKGVTADCITLKLIDMLAYVILFFLINVVLRVICTLLNSFSKLPVIKGVNKLAGGAIGLIEGVVFMWLVFVIITIFSATVWGGWCFEQIAASQILSVLYANNIFLTIV